MYTWSTDSKLTLGWAQQQGFCDEILGGARKTHEFIAVHVLYVKSAHRDGRYWQTKTWKKKWFSSMIFSTINQPYHHLVTLLSDAESFLEVTVEQTQNQGIIKPSPQPSTSPSNSNINNLKKKKKAKSQAWILFLWAQNRTHWHILSTPSERLLRLGEFFTPKIEASLWKHPEWFQGQKSIWSQKKPHHYSIYILKIVSDSRSSIWYLRSPWRFFLRGVSSFKIATVSCEGSSHWWTAQRGSPLLWNSALGDWMGHVPITFTLRTALRTLMFWLNILFWHKQAKVSKPEKLFHVANQGRMKWNKKRKLLILLLFWILAIFSDTTEKSM